MLPPPSTIARTPASMAYGHSQFTIAYCRLIRVGTTMTVDDGSLAHNVMKQEILLRSTKVLLAPLPVQLTIKIDDRSNEAFVVCYYVAQMFRS